MGNCDWLRDVIPAFNKPYFEKWGDWPAIEAKCRSGAYRLTAICSAAMAQQHIEEDLKHALIQHGCGSERDWDKVFEHIKSCTTEVMQATGSETPPRIGRYIASGVIYAKREQVRATCVAERTRLRLPMETNGSNGGNVCRPCRSLYSGSFC